jgi:hypothetical protein
LTARKALLNRDYAPVRNNLGFAHGWRFQIINYITRMKQGISFRFFRASISTFSLVASVSIVFANLTELRAQTTNCTPAPSGLVGWWKGDGNAMDSVATNNGTLVNVAYTNGVVGQAFSFDPESYPWGTYNGVQIPDQPAYAALTNSLTIEGWVRPRGDGWVIFHRGDNRPGYDPFTLSMQQNHDLRFLVQDANNNQAFVDTTLAYDQWTHVAATLDGSSGSLSLYTNGVLAAQTTTDVRPAGALIAEDHPGVCIGNENDGFNNFAFVGDIDEISLYNRALAPSEITSIYHAGSAGKCSVPPTVLNVTPTNLYVNEGTTAAFTVQATGSQISGYQWQHEGRDIPNATNSTLVLSNVVYSQNGNYDVIVSSADGWAVSSNVVLKVNRAPVADASATEPLTVSPNASNAVVVLNASKSSDPDGDALTYAWFYANETDPIATGLIALRTLPVGTNQLELAVDDGMAFRRQPFSIEVVTISQAVDRLAAMSQSGSTNNSFLVGSLEAALASMDHRHPQTAISRLRAFINQVQTRLRPLDPGLAAQLIADAQSIIDALRGGTPIPAAHVAITAITHDQNGRAHLKLKGVCGCANVVETSTNMVDWVPVGVATENSDGTYDFDDTQSPNTGMRFYRVVAH